MAAVTPAALGRREVRLEIYRGSWGFALRWEGAFSGGSDLARSCESRPYLKSARYSGNG